MVTTADIQWYYYKVWYWFYNHTIRHILILIDKIKKKRSLEGK